MTKKLPFTTAGLKRAIKAAQESGLRVTGIKPDGTLVLRDYADQRGTPPDELDDVWSHVEV